MANADTSPSDEWAEAEQRPVQCRAMRVARVWAGVSKPTWAQALGVSPATISIYETRKVPKLEIRQEAARLAGVPEAFLETGFPAVAHPVALEARIAALERRLDEPS